MPEETNQQPQDDAKTSQVPVSGDEDTAEVPAIPVPDELHEPSGGPLTPEEHG